MKIMLEISCQYIWNNQMLITINYLVTTIYFFTNNENDECRSFYNQWASCTWHMVWFAECPKSCAIGSCNQISGACSSVVDCKDGKLLRC